jgi:hypothetical protein
MEICKFCNQPNNNIGGHLAKCVEYKKQKNLFFDGCAKNKDLILSKYIKDEYSLTELLDFINDMIGTELGKSFAYSSADGKSLKTWLVDNGVYRKYTPTQRRTQKIKETTIKNHGVLNIGCTKLYGWNNTNKIEYKKVSFLTDGFKKYEKKVKTETLKSIRKKEILDFCEYTGIKFIDAELGLSVNPNDPRKRSVDHKIPVIWGYLNGIKPEVIGGIGNLAFVLRYVNTIKSNTLYESFIPIALKLREVFKNENYEVN